MGNQCQGNICQPSQLEQPLNNYQSKLTRFQQSCIKVLTLPADLCPEPVTRTIQSLHKAPYNNESIYSYSYPQNGYLLINSNASNSNNVIDNNVINNNANNNNSLNNNANNNNAINNNAINNNSSNNNAINTNVINNNPINTNPININAINQQPLGVPSSSQLLQQSIKLTKLSQPVRIYRLDQSGKFIGYYQGKLKQLEADDDQAIYVHVDGAYYCGQIKDNKAKGKGVYVNEVKQIRYEGEWEQDMPHGLGKMRKGNGQQYEGQFEYGKRQGTGVLKLQNCLVVYEGAFDKNQPNGVGMLTIFSWSTHPIDKNPQSQQQQPQPPSSLQPLQLSQSPSPSSSPSQPQPPPQQRTTYKGTFLKGYLSGHGSQQHPSYHYEGMFNNTIKCGQGVLKFKNGNQYIGTFKNDLPNGQGKLIKHLSTTSQNKENIIIEGIWLEGIYVGQKLPIKSDIHKGQLQKYQQSNAHAPNTNPTSLSPIKQQPIKLESTIPKMN